MGRSPVADAPDALIEAALAELTANGMTGLRVAAVARRAGTSTAMIYRHFGSRDGLLEAALLVWFERRIALGLAITASLLDRPAPIHLDDVLAVIPPPNHPDAEEQHRFVHRVLVLASEHHRLRGQITALLQRWQDELDDLVARIIERMPPEERFDGRIFSVFVAHHGWLSNDMLEERRLTNDEFYAFLRNLCAHTPPPDA